MNTEMESGALRRTPRRPGRGRALLRPLEPVGALAPVGLPQALSLAVALRKAFKVRRKVRASIASLTGRLKMIPGLVPFKEWVWAEMERTGLDYGGVFYRLQRGGYPDLLRIQVNTRVVYVLEAKRQSTAALHGAPRSPTPKLVNRKS